MSSFFFVTFMLDALEVLLLGAMAVAPEVSHPPATQKCSGLLEPWAKMDCSRLLETARDWSKHVFCLCHMGDLYHRSCSFVHSRLSACSQKATSFRGRWGTCGVLQVCLWLPVRLWLCYRGTLQFCPAISSCSRSLRRMCTVTFDQDAEAMISACNTFTICCCSYFCYFSCSAESHCLELPPEAFIFCAACLTFHCLYYSLNVTWLQQSFWKSESCLPTWKHNFSVSCVLM